MDELDYWRLCGSLTVVQAAALIAGGSPELVLPNERDYYIPDHTVRDDWEDIPQHQRLGSKFRAAFAALKHAIQDYGTNNGGLKARTRYLPLELGNGAVDWAETTVQVSDLRAWLESKGFATGFFFPNQEAAQPGYLDPNHPRYSAKLAAAVKAWQAMDDSNLLIGKSSPVAAMEDWLTSRYSELGLTWSGGINKTGITEAAKVANWQTFGGAPKTPVKE